jgi:hypothetical protein
MIAPHDAAFLRDLLEYAQHVCTCDPLGMEDERRYYTTQLQRHINRLPPDLVAKLERDQ